MNKDVQPDEVVDEAVDEAPTRKSKGLVCPQCGIGELYVSYRRQFKGGFRRVRICTGCAHRVLTFEAITGNANKRA